MPCSELTIAGRGGPANAVSPQALHRTRTLRGCVVVAPALGAPLSDRMRLLESSLLGKKTKTASTASTCALFSRPGVHPWRPACVRASERVTADDHAYVQPLGYPGEAGQPGRLCAPAALATAEELVTSRSAAPERAAGAADDCMRCVKCCASSGPLNERIIMRVLRVAGACVRHLRPCCRSGLTRLLPLRSSNVLSPVVSPLCRGLCTVTVLPALRRRFRRPRAASTSASARPRPAASRTGMRGVSMHTSPAASPTRPTLRQTAHADQSACAGARVSWACVRRTIDSRGRT